MGDDWLLSATCRGRYDEWCYEVHASAVELQKAYRVAHICKAHCPVLAQCTQEANEIRPALGIMAGRVWGIGRNRGRDLTAPDLPCDETCPPNPR